MFVVVEPSAHSWRCDPPIVLRARAGRFLAHVPSIMLQPHHHGPATRTYAGFNHPSIFEYDEASHTQAAQIMMQYLMHGYTARVFGPYRRDALHVGHGKTLRRFRLAQYNPKNLHVSI